MSRDTTTSADETEVLALVERIESEILTILERHTQMHDEAVAPRFNRHVAIHATVDLAGRLMQSAIAIEGERARETCQGLIEHLQLLIAPSTSSSARPS